MHDLIVLVFLILCNSPDNKRLTYRLMVFVKRGALHRRKIIIALVRDRAWCCLQLIIKKTLKLRSQQCLNTKRSLPWIICEASFTDLQYHYVEDWSQWTSYTELFAEVMPSGCSLTFSQEDSSLHPLTYLHIFLVLLSSSQCSHS